MDKQETQDNKTNLRMYAAVPTKSPPSATIILSSSKASSNSWSSFTGLMNL